MRGGRREGREEEGEGRGGEEKGEGRRENRSPRWPLYCRTMTCR